MFAKKTRKSTLIFRPMVSFPSHPHIFSSFPWRFGGMLGPTMKILIADDDRISRLLIQRILESDGGHSLTVANDGEEAWQQLLASPEPFDVCMLDIMMPRLDGLGLITRMRANSRFKNLPVILCTALNDRTTVQKAVLLSVTQYIVKPYTRANVVEKVHLVHSSMAGHQSLEEGSVVCARLGVDSETYRTLMESLLEDAREWTELLLSTRSLAGQQALLVRLNGLKGSALSLGARDLATQLRVAEETLEKTEAKDREKFGPPDNLVADVKREIEVLQKHLQAPPRA
jgi:CheY-like chemotaxis protein